MPCLVSFLPVRRPAHPLCAGTARPGLFLVQPVSSRHPWWDADPDQSAISHCLYGGVGLGSSELAFRRWLRGDCWRKRTQRRLSSLQAVTPVPGTHEGPGVLRTLVEWRLFPPIPSKSGSFLLLILCRALCGTSLLGEQHLRKPLSGYLSAYLMRV